MRFSRLHDAVPGGRGTPPQNWRRDAPGVIACAGTERAFVRAPDSTNKTEDQRTYSVSVPDAWLLREPDVLPSVTAAVRRGAMSLISRRAAPPRPALARAPVLVRRPLARPSLAVTPPTRATLIRSLASRPASAYWQAPGVAHQPRLVPAHGPGPAPAPLGPLTKGTGGQEPLAQEIPRCRQHGRRSGQCPGGAWCRLCSDRAGHGGVHGTIAWGTCGARRTATRSDTSARDPLRQGFMGRSSRRTI
jgi:hypothetical protein